MSESASRISLRRRAIIWPRQSASSAICVSIRSDGFILFSFLITARTPTFVLRLAACFGEFQALCQGCRALPLVSHSTDTQPLLSGSHTTDRGEPGRCSLSTCRLKARGTDLLDAPLLAEGGIDLR